MKDCAEGMASPHGYLGNDGRYFIQPEGSPQPFPVFCIMAFNTGRMFVLSRESGTVDFNRTWTDYVEGFGSVTGDHWIGLKNLYSILQDDDYNMNIQLTISNSTLYRRRYKYFQIKDENDKFQMTFTGTSASATGEPLGDCLTSLKGSYFSTPDNDNDNSPDNCAAQFESGWWFDACAVCNPTGILEKPTDGLWTGVDSEAFWTPGLGNCAPDKIEMYLSLA